MRVGKIGLAPSPLALIEAVHLPLLPRARQGFCALGMSNGKSSVRKSAM
jgi:hypothetical protein